MPRGSAFMRNAWDALGRAGIARKAHSLLERLTGESAQCLGDGPSAFQVEPKLSLTGEAPVAVNFYCLYGERQTVGVLLKRENAMHRKAFIQNRTSRPVAHASEGGDQVDDALVGDLQSRQSLDFADDEMASGQSSFC